MLETKVREHDLSRNQYYCNHVPVGCVDTKLRLSGRQTHHCHLLLFTCPKADAHFASTAATAHRTTTLAEQTASLSH